MNTTGARSFPAGHMQITRHGNLIQSVHMPLWNPGQIVNVTIDQELVRRSFFDPCRIECLLNPSVSERPSSHYRVQVTLEAEDQIGVLAYATNIEALAHWHLARTALPANPNSARGPLGSATPTSPTVSPAPVTLWISRVRKGREAYKWMSSRSRW